MVRATSWLASAVSLLGTWKPSCHLPHVPPRRAWGDAEPAALCPQCSSTCGKGLQSRVVQCMHKVTGRHGSECPALAKPSTYRQCHLEVCNDKINVNTITSPRLGECPSSPRAPLRQRVPPGARGGPGAGRRLPWASPEPWRGDTGRLGADRRWNAVLVMRKPFANFRLKPRVPPAPRRPLGSCGEGLPML